MAHEWVGSRRVLELNARKALTDFSMGGSAKAIAWSVNPYLGCLHGCQYCYVPSTMHLQRGRWGSYVGVKRNIANLLRLETKRRPKLTTYLSTATDPYQSVEADHLVTRACLRVLAQRDWPVEVLTRSPLVLRDLDVLGRLTSVRVGMSVATLDDDVRRILEPTAPTVDARLRALARLSDAGLAVFANYSPAYPPTGGHTMDDVADAFSQAGVQWVNVSRWRRTSHILGPLWDRLHDTRYAALAKYVGNPARQRAAVRALSMALARVGIVVHTGFFNPPFERLHRPEPVKPVRHTPLPIPAEPPVRRQGPTRA